MVGELGGNYFEFDVVTIDRRGNYTRRSRGHAEFFTENLGSGVLMEMVAIKGGNFLMGITREQILSRYPDAIVGFTPMKSSASPQHQVTVPPFFMGKYPVTQVQWSTVASLPKVSIDLKQNPSYFTGASRPVEQVSWKEAVEFCNRLSSYTAMSGGVDTKFRWQMQKWEFRFTDLFIIQM